LGATFKSLTKFWATSLLTLHFKLEFLYDNSKQALQKLFEMAPMYALISLTPVRIQASVPVQFSYFFTEIMCFVLKSVP